ncbi:hypothetical protein ACWDG1_47680 [Streptomyces sp. NPDC001177]
MDDQRYHLLLAAESQPTMHGWWVREATARSKFSRWVGDYGTMPGVRIPLVDEETSKTLTTWPEES